MTGGSKTLLYICSRIQLQVVSISSAIFPSFQNHSIGCPKTIKPNFYRFVSFIINLVSIHTLCTYVCIIGDFKQIGSLFHLLHKLLYALWGFSQFSLNFLANFVHFIMSTSASTSASAFIQVLGASSFTLGYLPQSCQLRLREILCIWGTYTV